MIESRQSYCKESRVQFFWPTVYYLKMTHKNVMKFMQYTVSEL